MKVPLSWLKDYVDIDIPIAELVERLTVAGLEVTGVQPIGLPFPDGLQAIADQRGPVWDRDKVITAQVLEVNKHPDADRLTLVTLEYGAAEPKIVVTGAPNLKPGDKGQRVILALSGSVLFDGHSEEKVLKKLKPTKIRGIPSDSMVCSAKELGLSEENEGIIILEEDAPVGVPLADYMGDLVLEIDVLPNMSRCLSMIGMAREVSALTGQPLKSPPDSMQADGESVKNSVQVEIADSQLCARYAAALIRKVRQGHSPGWMQRRLQMAGMRPIGNIVDITNYVMLESGQPLHAFDYDKLVARASGESPTIIVRPAKSGETIVTIDEKERKLTPDHLLIADKRGPIAIAGVMGGAETEVASNTQNILLESANFLFTSVRRTARELDLPSEASYRFSRQVPADGVPVAARRAAEFMRSIAGGVISTGIVDCYPGQQTIEKIMLPWAEILRVLGIEIAKDEVNRVLTSLEFTIEANSDESLTVSPPAHRLDLQHGPADLIEEIARIYGYDRLPATMLGEPLPIQKGNSDLDLEEQVRDTLALAGLHEAMTYSLTTPERERPFADESADYLGLANPVSSERAALRLSVLAGLLEVISGNLKHESDVRMFEIGYVYGSVSGEKLPRERRRLAIAMTGGQNLEHWATQSREQPLDIFDLKGVIESLQDSLGIIQAEYRATEREGYHPRRTAQIFLKDEPLGTLGEIHPEAAARFGFDGHRILAAELDLDLLLKAAAMRQRFSPISEFPPVRQDLAIIVDDSLLAHDIINEIQKAGSKILHNVTLFDEYRGENIPPGKRSLAFALTYQSLEKTLTDKEVAKVHGKIVNRLEKVLKAELRS